MKMISILLLFPLLALSDTAAEVFTSQHGNSISLAIAALPNGVGTVHVDASIVVSSTIGLPSNVVVSCSPGVSITQTDKTKDIFAWSGTVNNGVSGCRLIGGHSYFSAYGFDHFTGRDNWGTGASYRGVDFGRGATNTLIQGNIFAAFALGCTDGIYVEEPGSTFAIIGNTVDTSGCTVAGTAGAHGIAIHTASAGGTAAVSKILDNTIFQGGSNFAIEVGKFNSGNFVVAPLIRGNHIKLMLAGNGGISVDHTVSPVISENIVDLGGFAPLIAAVESVASDGCSIASNAVFGGAPDARAFSLDSSSDCDVTGNQWGGAVFVTNSGNTGFLTLRRNSMHGDKITIPAGSAWPNAIFFQCNVAACDGSGNHIEGETISGPATVILLQNSLGSVDGNRVVGNMGGTLSTSGNVTRLQPN